MSNKHRVLEALWQHCQNGNYQFDNNLVADICKKFGFKNQFDITKIDSKDDLPPSFLDQDICLLHLGKGRHQFVHGIDKLYYTFEPMQDSIEWKYRKRLLDDANSSESNILSIANHQRILHHFLFFNKIPPPQRKFMFQHNEAQLLPMKSMFGHNVIEFRHMDLDEELYCKSCRYSYATFLNGTAKTYFPHRTKTSLEYCFNGEKINAINQQIEIDLAIEYNGTVCIFEAKNGTPKDFNICQIYHPFLYYYNSGLNFRQIICVYFVYNKNSLKLWAYTFDEPKCLDSIKPLKSCEYILKWY